MPFLLALPYARRLFHSPVREVFGLYLAKHIAAFIPALFAAV